jgi:hypothetical protein
MRQVVSKSNNYSNNMNNNKDKRSKMSDHFEVNSSMKNYFLGGRNFYYWLLLLVQKAEYKRKVRCRKGEGDVQNCVEVGPHFLQRKNSMTYKIKHGDSCLQFQEVRPCLRQESKQDWIIWYSLEGEGKDNRRVKKES